MSEVRTYDPEEVLIIINGVPMSGFGDDSMVSVEREEDTYTKVVGCDGKVSRSRSRNRSGSMTLTLKATSPSNDVLSGIALLDEQKNEGVVPVLIKDMLGTTVITSAFGWIRKMPSPEFGKEVGDREWEFDLSDVDMFIGGNVGVGR